jgi:hypothetical protein
MHEWNRQALWAEHDAMHQRRLRRSSFGLFVAVLAMWLGFALMSYASSGLLAR